MNAGDSQDQDQRGEGDPRHDGGVRQRSPAYKRHLARRAEACEVAAFNKLVQAVEAVTEYETEQALEHETDEENDMKVMNMRLNKFLNIQQRKKMTKVMTTRG